MSNSELPCPAIKTYHRLTLRGFDTDYFGFIYKQIVSLGGNILLWAVRHIYVLFHAYLGMGW